MDRRHTTGDSVSTTAPVHNREGSSLILYVVWTLDGLPSVMHRQGIAVQLY